MTEKFWHAHAHSRYSVLDGMVSIESMVAKAAKMGQPALAITDHGTLAGLTQLYFEAKKYGIKPFPGVETYIVHGDDGTQMDPKAKRYHLGILALDTNGYQGLVKLISMSHTRPRFNRFPRLATADLMEFGAEYGENVAITTGCYFGLIQQAVMENPKSALRLVKSLAQTFPHLYVEVQNHGIDHSEDHGISDLTDEDLVNELLHIADRTGLPIIATQDAHYLDQQQKVSHNLMKKMVYGGVEDEFPGDSFHLASSEWVEEHYSPKVWARVLDGLTDLLNLNNVTIPPLDNYKPRVPSISKDPQKVLNRRSHKFLDTYLRTINPRKHKTYRERLDYELDVIQKLGQADYLLLCLKCVTWCRDMNICVEARGSSNGSLVCFLMGITQVDPIKYGVTFDRFLSVDRIKPPDVDMDIEDVERHRLLAYLANNFETTQIGTFSKMGSRDDDDKGSALVTYKSYLAREVEQDYESWRTKEQKRTGSKTKPRDPRREAEVKDLKARVYASIQTMTDIRNNFPEDYPALKKMAAMGTVNRSYGVHAGGILVSGPGVSIKDWIPTMLVASSNTKVSMFDMDDVERWGLMKMDWLGQRSLAIMKRCQEMIGRDNPCDFSWIPEDDPEACKLLRSGRPDTGIFHQEGKSKAYGWRELGVRSTADVILGTALYMPGAMDSGQKDLYIKRRRNPELRKQIDYPHPVFEKVLRSTYGTVIYQEQVLDIMRGLGLDIGTINVLFKIVKDSGAGSRKRNAGRLKEIKKTFFDACTREGVKDPQHSWDWLTGMAAYGFNHAHATGYGIRSYRCAYLKAHHPLEFMSALLEANAGGVKEKIYIREARRMELRLLGAHVNVSKESWTIDRKLNAIRRGLLSIKGIGSSVANEIVSQMPYLSVRDLCQRCKNPVSGRDAYLKDGTLTGSILALHNAGALSGMDD